MGQRRSASAGRGIRLELLEPRQLLSFSINGRVFADLNADGRHQRKEPYLPGIQVYLDLNGNGHLDTGEPVSATDKHGKYHLKKLARGAYDLSIVSPSGWTPTVPVGGTYVFAKLNHGVNRTFALRQVPPTQVGGAPTDTAPPTAALSAPDVTANGSGSYTFAVTYVDATAVAVSSLGSGNVVVAGPGGFVEAANLIAFDQPTDGSPRTATYQIAPPNGTWSADDDGTYTITLAANQVRDTLGNVMPAQTLGSFNVAIGIPTPATPQLLASSDTGASASDHLTRLNNASPASALRFQIANVTAGATVTLYADGSGIGSTISSDGVVVVASDGQSALSDGTHLITARQTLSSGLQSAASDPLTINMDTTSPAAQLAASPVIASGGHDYSFAVTYTDAVAIDANSLGTGDILVTGPNGYQQNAAFVAMDAAGNGPSRTATYRIIPPNGTWDVSDDGNYSVTLEPNQVDDSAGNSVPGGSLGTFSVNAASPGSDRPGEPLLVSASDTGAYNNDRITRLNNSAPAAALQFLVPGTVAGATVSLYADGSLIAQAVATGATATLTTSGSLALSDGSHLFTARQAEPTLPQSDDSIAEGVFIDTTSPTAASNPASVSGFGATDYSFTVVYNDNVALNAVTLTGNNDILVTNSQGFSQPATFVSINDPTNGMPRTVTYHITPPGGSWDAGDNGTYAVLLQANKVFDVAGNAAPGGALATFVVNAAVPVSPAPSTPQLLPGSDTGLSATDNATSRNNASAASVLQFTVANTTPGATVTLYADGNPIGQTSATAANATITTNPGFVLSDGPHTFTARQTLPGSAQSPDSGGASVNIDTAAPKASTSLSAVTTAGGTGYNFMVTYTDNNALDASTIDSNDIVVAGPNGFSQNATLIAVDSRANSNRRIASYHISAPGGTWDSADSGSYTVTLQGGQVFDVAGNAAGLTVLGAFSVNISAATSPVPAKPTLLANSDTGTSSSDGITSFNNASQSARLQFSVAGTTPGATVTLYADGVPVGSAVASGSGTTVITNGTFTLGDGAHNFTARQQVSGAPQSGDSSSSVVTIDSTGPAGSLTGGDITTPGNTNYFFTVTYSDADGIDLSTLHDDNVLVTGPNGYSQTATFVSVDVASNGSPRTATYQIRPSGDEWTYTDNGIYTVTLQGGQVRDMAGNAAAQATLGTFNVAVPTPAPVGVYLSATSDDGTSNSDRITSLNNSTANTTLQFTVTGTFAGATVSLYSDGTFIGSATGNDGATVVTTNGIATLAPGQHNITARQTLPGAPQSVDSTALKVTIVTTPQ